MSAAWLWKVTSAQHMFAAVCTSLLPHWWIWSEVFLQLSLNGQLSQCNYSALGLAIMWLLPVIKQKAPKKQLGGKLRKKCKARDGEMFKLRYVTGFKWRAQCSLITRSCCRGIDECFNTRPAWRHFPLHQPCASPMWHGVDIKAGKRPQGLSIPHHVRPIWLNGNINANWSWLPEAHKMFPYTLTALANTCAPHPWCTGSVEGLK